MADPRRRGVLCSNCGSAAGAGLGFRAAELRASLGGSGAIYRAAEVILGVRAQGNRSEINGEDRVRPLLEEGRQEGDDRRARAASGRAQRGAGEPAVQCPPAIPAGIPP